MPYLTGNQRTRAYGSYNSRNNTFMLNTINNGSCWIPRQARCQAPCGAFYPDKDGELPVEYLNKYAGWVQERKNAIKNADNKRISGTVRVPSSEYQMNKASGLSTQNIIFNYYQPKTGYERNDLDLLQWNQSSDRAFPSRMNRSNNVNVPSHGNSTKTSLTRHRPGAGAGGKQYGVDLKHNSYHRYLLKKKGLKPLRGEKQKVVPWNDPKPHQSKAVFDKSVQNNKWRKDSIVANMNHCSLDLDSDCKPKPAPEPAPEPEVKPEDLLKYFSVDDNKYMELTGGKGTPNEPFTGKSTNTESNGDNFDAGSSGFDETRAIITFKAEHPSQVTVNIESSSEGSYDAAFLFWNNKLISLGTENKGNITSIDYNDIPNDGTPGSMVARIAFVGDYGQSGNNKSSTTTLVVGAGDKIKIIYDKESYGSLHEDAITEFSVYAEPLTSHKELPKSIVQEQDFFKTSLKEVEPKKAPEDFFNINKFDYTVKSDNKIERIKESTLDLILTDLNNIEELYESNSYIIYMDSSKKEVKVLLKELASGVKVTVSKPVSFKFRSEVANFDASFENDVWVCNPPVSKHKKDIFVFDQLQNCTLVAKINK